MAVKKSKAKKSRAKKSKAKKSRARVSKSSGQPGKKTSAGFVPAAISDADIADYVVVEFVTRRRWRSARAVCRTRRGRAASGFTEHAFLQNSISRRVRSHFQLPAAGDQISCRGGGDACRRSRTRRGSPEGEWIPTSSRAASCRSCRRRAATPRRSRGNSTGRRRSGRRTSRRVRCRRCRRIGSRQPQLRAVAGLSFTPRPTASGREEVWGLAGAKGNGVTICDIEGNWNRTHEDLPSRHPAARRYRDRRSRMAEPRNRGAGRNGFASPTVKGASASATRRRRSVHSAFINGVFNAAGAISNAASQFKAGDVILIELQATGPNSKYVAMQYWPDIFSAIRRRSTKGITVVEAAGNGDENFDLAIFNKTGLQKDSGAIVVGAGVPPTNHLDFDGFGAGLPGYRRSAFRGRASSFPTTARSSTCRGGAGTSRRWATATRRATHRRTSWYTLRFSGTSSASPIVTGAVACLQGRAKAKNGAPMTPKKVREILMATGTPQQAGPGVPLTQHIGPLPNLVEAMKKV